MNHSFSDLTPDLVLDLTEQALGRRCANHCRPLNSYINRVYEVQTDEREAFIIKVYRPGRWSRDALQDEHDFMLELQADDIPVIAPLSDPTGNTLIESEGLFYAVYPRKGGRVCDEPSSEQWQQLGRLIARTHQVGAKHMPRDRITMHPEISTTQQLEDILQSGCVSTDLRTAYEDIVQHMIGETAPLFDDVAMQRIHADCHAQNLIDRRDGTFYIIDFDDLAIGPPVQDLWMLLPGRIQDARSELDAFLDGYETFLEFDYASLRLIEALRAMRYVHYTAWCARQAADGGFARLAPDWGSHNFWRQEVHEMEKQLMEIQDAQETPW
ncbi:MAG: serine/threonine protein kinase [Kiritimatiellae bacterium]|nr:serine/threonine protein kinase [Kiritimatiellia bacterium]